VRLTANQRLSLEFALKKGAVRWSDLSLNQGIKLLPEAKGKDTLAAHYLPSVSNQDGATVRDESGSRGSIRKRKM
jgi:hypothetical protein